MTYFSPILNVHSWLRWGVLLVLLLSIIRSYQGWIFHKTIEQKDRGLNKLTLALLYTQFSLGIYLYFNSPMVNYFLHNFKESVPNTQLRFFGMEHITAMSLSILLISVGSYRAFRKTTDQKKFKCLALYLSLAFVIIFLSIPWSFSPFTARPDFRGW